MCKISVYDFDLISKCNLSSEVLHHMFCDKSQCGRLQVKVVQHKIRQTRPM